MRARFHYSSESIENYNSRKLRLKNKAEKTTVATSAVLPRVPTGPSLIGRLECCGFFLPDCKHSSFQFTNQIVISGFRKYWKWPLMDTFEAL